MSKVNRGTYQKVVEENKRLLIDIQLLVEEGMPTAEKILCMGKWRDKFKKQKKFNFLMQEACREFIKKHPKDKAVIAFKEIHSPT